MQYSQHIVSNEPMIAMITLEISNKCNYACSYCPPDIHNGTHDWLDLDACMRFFKELSLTHERVYINLTGGEPTMWPRLQEFLVTRPDYCDIEITSNGSRTLRWWTDAKPHLQKVALSYHPGLADVDHLIAVVDLLRDTVILHNNILFDPAYRHDTERYALAMRERGIAAEVKPIIPQWETMLPYTDEEIEWMETVSGWPNQPLPPLRKPSMVSIDGGPFVDMNLELIAPQLNHFKDWHCWAGRDRFHIKYNGDIQAASCGIATIGNIHTGWNIQTKPVVCNRTSCWCSDDVAIEKYLL